jgi:hypothetical protein
MCNKQFLERKKHVKNSFWRKKYKNKHVFFSLCPLKTLFFFEKKNVVGNNKTRESFPFISLFEMPPKSSKALIKKANTQSMSSVEGVVVVVELE